MLRARAVKQRRHPAPGNGLNTVWLAVLFLWYIVMQTGRIRSAFFFPGPRDTVKSHGEGPHLLQKKR